MRALPLLALLATFHAKALELAGVFGDHMVLQRDAPLHIWGRAEPGQRVRVQIAGGEAGAQAGQDGRWQATLKPLKAGGPHELRVSAGADQRLLADVLIGDVWVAAGQSNMEWRLADTLGAAADVAAADLPRIRHARMPHRASLTPLRDTPPLAWDISSPTAAGEFSAVAWHFARRVQAETGVPIGLLNLSWGGTPIETWTSPRAAAADPDLAGTMRTMPTDEAAFVQRRRGIILERVRRFQGDAPSAVDGADPALDDSGWPTLNAPQVWETQGLPGLDGRIWLRRHVTLTAAEAAGAATLHLARVDDCDESFVNGHPVGQTCGWDQPRAYALPAGLLHAGDNLVAVRVTDTGGDGGIHGPATELRLDTAAGPRPLAGRWRARVEALQTLTEPGPNDLPGLLFNGMVSPMTPFAVRGVIWYQGETNAPRAARYAQAFPRLIGDWRAQWREQGQKGLLPFYFVQLASYGPRPPLPEGSAFAELREAQRQTAARVPGTGMAVSIDVGDADDIHPRDKRTVGERLARIALVQSYGRAMPFRGPTLKSSRFLPDGRIELRFADVAGGLATRGGGPLLGFALAGEDQRFQPARAEIVGRDRVRLSSDAVRRPAAVRYAWADTPLEANLVDGAGLPASPWRSDHWPLVTRDVRPEF
ncbi:sialate O-acetylesterase [Roseateles saccharophilus]|uniref:Sialate O-acetylesterase n=1 Tax=Roseateles saccharophilus TaxID=304 RepID=A0A4R3VFW9_ROSSA|nr:sialate O-acetylesterase [Roseateles saccharophilus]MDG0831196.1 9-O-acetylesterase [Roseateles saccharophilus]TCV04316.1 sialate O-acetylesterase [Roseateles saccharophilus]